MFIIYLWFIDCLIIIVNFYTFSSCHDDIINFENHTDAFGGKSKSTQGNQRWLNDVVLKHVINFVSLNVEAFELETLYVSITKFSHKCNWVKSSIFSKGVWNQFKGLSEVSHTV